MPKENRKRGRRGQEQKRKRDDGDEESDRKRLKADEEPESQVVDELSLSLEHNHSHVASGPADAPFYGTLDEPEQEYFKRADEMLGANHFESREDRLLFVANVYKEAEGKELKIANSQSCSRLMERLIQLSNSKQLKHVFEKFSGHFVHLMQHRFASHCCERLFLESAAVVIVEKRGQGELDGDTTEEAAASMKELFLDTLDELEDSLGFLMTDKYASHVLRVLLVILSGQPLPGGSANSLLKSKRKEGVEVSGAASSELSLEKERPVPDAFKSALDKIIKATAAGLDTSYLRLLATHPTGNPVLQLLLRLEMGHYGKQRAKDEGSILRKLLPDDPIIDGTDSAAFISNMQYDAVGSRLLETVIELCPGKTFKSMYKHFFKERLGSLVRNEIASYPAIKVLERLSKEDLQEALEHIVPQLPKLIERNRTAVLRVAIDRCTARGADTAPIVDKVQEIYGGPVEFDICRFLLLNTVPQKQEDASGMASISQSAKAHQSLLAQSMLSAGGRLSNLIFNALLRIGAPIALQISKDPIASRTFQAALMSPNASIIFRRKMIQQLYGHIGQLALDPSGSHVIDAIWKGTNGLAFIRERLAEELAEDEASLRDSHFGRAVWRNWKMDLYKRKRAEWAKYAKTNGNDGFVDFPAGEKPDIPGETLGPQQRPLHSKSALELAREKHAAKVAKAATASKSASKDETASG